KMSELQAAMRLAVLPYMHQILQERSQRVNWYNQALKHKGLDKVQIRDLTIWNSGYYPVLFESESQLIHGEKCLTSNGVFPRRYFYPSLNNLPYVSENELDIAPDVSKRILCLPLFYELSKGEVERIASIINNM
ncbi:MAG: DegT/DnrJ/EryC1/StrS family aminotransferase, partial [Flavobacteriales bacterium]